ncbi:MAG: LytR/AlgR family response regulator transcription factor [Flammeovirgaceae bacterium]
MQELINIQTLQSAKSRWYHILLTSILTFLFINVYEPFELYSQNASTPFEVFLEMTQAVIVASIFLIFSQFGLRKFFHIQQFSMWGILGWFCLECLAIGSIWFGLSFWDKGIIDTLFNDWFENTIGCILLMAPPYFSSLFLLNTIHKGKSLSSMQQKLAEHEPSPHQLIPFLDEFGKEKIQLKLSDILYLESSDNYVEIHYLNNEQICTYLLRNSLKNLSAALEKLPIVRCHRSFMVNQLNIVAQHKKGKGLLLELRAYPNKKIPVSHRYTSEISKSSNLTPPN